jgi:protein TonB
MDFAQQQRNPTKHLVGLTFVALLHVIIIWALVNGLATKVIDVLKKPVEAKIIEDVKPPPPPEPKLPPPPKLQAPPPPYIPPPEVQVQTPPPVATISVQSDNKPVQQEFQKQVVAPPAAPTVKSVTGSCSNVGELNGSIQFPAKAARQGITEGNAEATFVVSGGSVTDLSLRGSNRLFTEVMGDVVKRLKCQDGRYAWKIDFKTED